MLARLRAVAPRALPNGWIDVARQVAIFGALYYGYRIVRGAIDGHTTAAAFEHARDIIGIERSLHLFIEPAVQAWGTSTGWVSDIASWLYVLPTPACWPTPSWFPPSTSSYLPLRERSDPAA